MGGRGGAEIIRFFFFLPLIRWISMHPLVDSDGHNCLIIRINVSPVSKYKICPICHDLVLNEENHGDQMEKGGGGEKNKERDRKCYV
jgi:hypothetical protein